MLQRLVFALLSLLPGLALAFGSLSGTYLADNRPAELLYLSLTQSSDSLSGSLSVVTSNGKGSTQAQTFSATGTVNGDHVDIRATQGPLGSSLHLEGTKSWNSLSLSAPHSTGYRITLTFKPVSNDYFNRSLAQWQEQLASAQARIDVAQAEKAKEQAAIKAQQDNIAALANTLAGDVQGMKSTGIPMDLASLESSVRDAGGAVTQIQRDLGQLKHDAGEVPMTPYQACQTVGYDYYQTLRYDYSQTLGYSVGTFKRALDTLEKRLGNAPTVIANTNRDTAVLERAMKQSRAPQVRLDVTPEEAKAEVAKYQAIVADAQGRLPKLVASLDQLVQDGKTLMAEGQLIVEQAQRGMRCR